MTVRQQKQQEQDPKRGRSEDWDCKKAGKYKDKEKMDYEKGRTIKYQQKEGTGKPEN